MPLHKYYTKAARDWDGFFKRNHPTIAWAIQFRSHTLSDLVHLSGGEVRMHTLVRRESNSNFGFGGDSSGEDRLELGKASFADTHNRRNALE